MGILSISNYDLASTTRGFWNPNEPDELVMTLGARSYISTLDLRYESEGGIKRSHLMIGRYSSLGAFIYVLLATGHTTRSVSTYPFGSFAEFHPDNKLPKNSHRTFSRKKLNEYKQLIIGNDVWIGDHVTIVGNVRIGNGAIIGAGAVVREDVPPYAIMVGNPAKILRYRFPKDICDKLNTIKWWYNDVETVKAQIEEMDDPASYVAKYYKPQVIPETEDKKALDELKRAGYKIFGISLDSAEYSGEIYLKLLAEYVRDKKDTDKVVLIKLLAGELPPVIRAKEEQILSVPHAPAVVEFTISPEDVPLDLLSTVDLYFTTVQELSMIHLDFAADFGARIRYAYDDDVFLRE